MTIEPEKLVGTFFSGMAKGTALTSKAPSPGMSGESDVGTSPTPIIKIPDHKQKSKKGMQNSILKGVTKA